jgi:glycosyltransferase involved in cell wall biosynthesis
MLASKAVMDIAFVTLNPFHRLITPLEEYLRIFADKGHHVTLFATGDSSRRQPGKNLCFREVCGAHLHSKAAHLLFILKMLAFLRKENYDVIHLFNAPGLSLLPLCCKSAAKKWVLDIRTVRIEGGIRAFLYDRLKIFESRFFDRTILLGEGLRKKLFGNRSHNRTSIVPLGANLAKFRHTENNRSLWDEFNIARDSIILLYIGKIDRTRGINKLIEAFSILRHNKTDRKLEMVIIGGPDSMIEDLKNHAGLLSVSEHTHFLGSVPYDVIHNYVANSDIGLAYIPKNAVYDTQPPLKTFEYLAASLPVVATNTTANCEIIGDGDNGIIAADHPNDFAQAIQRLLDDPHLMQQIKAHSVQSIAEYDWEKIANRLEMIYSTP